MDLSIANECWQNLLAQLAGQLNPTIINTYLKPLTVFYCDNKYLIFRADNSFNANHINLKYIDPIYNLAPIHFNGARFETVKALDPAECDSFMRTINVSRLNPKYTFDSFVTGQSNILAYSAAVAVADKPGSDEYNPLFLHGGPGLGKTHLMTAIANQLLLNNPRTNVQFYTYEQFTNEVVDAIRLKRTKELRDRLRSCDILLIDDIQLLAGRSATQEEFFNTFNDLYARGKQIVMSADKPPQYITTLEERMRSRFGSGIVMAIDKPDFETRIAILKNKAAEDNILVDEDAFALMAERIDSNIRVLEGNLKTCAFAAQNMPGNGRVTVEIVNVHVSGMTVSEPTEKAQASHEDIIAEVARRRGVTVAEILSENRSAAFTAARQMAMYLIREICQYSLPTLGQVFGRDHTTAIYAIKQAKKKLETDPEFAQTVEELLRQFK